MILLWIAPIACETAPARRLMIVVSKSILRELMSSGRMEDKKGVRGNPFGEDFHSVEHGGTNWLENLFV